MSPVFGTYKVRTFPMVVPGTQGLITELKEIPELMVISEDRNKVGTIKEIPIDGIVKNKDVTWHGNESCVFAVVSSKPEIAHQVCKFVVKKEEISPQAIKLKDYGENDLYILTNVINAQVKCEDSTGIMETAVTTVNCSLCFLKLQCQCNRRQNKVLTEIMAEGNSRVLAFFVHTHNFEYVRSNRGHVETEMTTV